MIRNTHRNLRYGIAYLMVNVTDDAFHVVKDLVLLETYAAKVCHCH